MNGRIMKSIKRIPFIEMIIMAVMSFLNLYWLKYHGTPVTFGVVYFFLHRISEEQSIEGSGLNVKAIGTNFKNRGIWVWVALPLIVNATSITIAKLFLSEFIEHVLARTMISIPFDKIILIVLHLIILALGEEIAWRAFFQNQLNKVFSIKFVLIISSMFMVI